jgi:hypothetical protein
MGRTIGTFNFRDGFADGTSARDYTNKFITGRTCVLAAGNPIYEDNTDIADLLVIGVTQNWGLNQQKQLQKVFELGSDENTIVPGRSQGRFQLSKVWYNGPTLIKSLYPNLTQEQIDAMYKKPGYGDFLFNLESDLSDTPFGLCFVVFDLANTFVGGGFFENAYMETSGTAMSAQAIILAQQVSVQYERVFPIPQLGV